MEKYKTYEKKKNSLALTHVTVSAGQVDARITISNNIELCRCTTS